MSACKFCALLAARDLALELPNLIVETPAAVAVLNRRPVAPGHVTIMLKRHHVRTSDMRDEDWTGIGTLSGRIAGFLEREYQPARVVCFGDGKRSAHFHLHLAPEVSPDFSVAAAVADLNQSVRPATLPDADVRLLVPRLRASLG